MEGEREYFQFLTMRKIPNDSASSQIFHHGYKLSALQKSLVAHTTVVTVLLVGNATDGTNRVMPQVSRTINYCVGTLSEQAVVVVLECSNAQTVNHAETLNIYYTVESANLTNTTL